MAALLASLAVVRASLCASGCSPGRFGRLPPQKTKEPGLYCKGARSRCSSIMFVFHAVALDPLVLTVYSLHWRSQEEGKKKDRHFSGI